MRIVFVLFSAALLSLFAQSQTSPNCSLRASPPPMATFGGPATAAPGTTELGLAFGAFGEGHPSECAIDMTGAADWFVRWRRGVSDKSDLGFDALFDEQGGGTLTGTAKVAARYEPKEGVRLEGGVGAADSGDGRSVNGDLAAMIGTDRPPGDTWNYYASLRVAASHGCFNLLCWPGSGAPGSRAPGAIIPLGVLGSTARVSDTTRFVMEGGLGEFFSRQDPHSGLYIHLAFGVQFNVGRSRRKAPRAGIS